MEPHLMEPHLMEPHLMERHLMEPHLMEQSSGLSGDASTTPELHLFPAGSEPTSGGGGRYCRTHGMMGHCPPSRLALTLENRKWVIFHARM